MEQSKSNAASPFFDRAATVTDGDAPKGAGDTDLRARTVNIALNADLGGNLSIVDQVFADRTQLNVSIDDLEAVASILEKPPNLEAFQLLMAAHRPWKN